MRITEIFHRFRLGTEKPWEEREQVRVDVLAQVRVHPGFQALLDLYDSEVVTLFEQWLQTEPEKLHVLRDLHGQARAVYRMIRRMDEATLARDQGERLRRTREDLERMVHAHDVDKQARRAATEAAIAQRRQGRETLLTGASLGG